MDDLIRCVEQNIARHDLLPNGSTVVLGVSGGIDSMVLLHVFYRLSGVHSWKLIVAHFNHQLRGKDSDADERFVTVAAKKLRLQFETERQDVKKHAKAHRLSIEMAARQLRHEFLARVATRVGAQYIAVAHHTDDQVELFFLRLLRGAGAQGLSGMNWKSPSPALRSVTLVRPFLAESKSTLREFARRHRIRFREDVTNSSADIFRNRIRHKLLPLLRKNYQPSLNTAILRSMELIRDENNFLAEQSLNWLKRRRPAFETLHVALQRRVIQAGLLAQGVVPQFDHVEELRTKPSMWLAVRADLACRRTPEGDIEARVPSRFPFIKEEVVIELLRSRHVIFDSLGISWKVTPGFKLPARSSHTEFFDADAVGDEIILRHWHAGDRYRPIGMKHVVKLQDFFVNQKIPRERRHELLLATTVRGEIFWIEDQRIGERFKVKPDTKRILKWVWKRADVSRRRPTQT